MKHLLFSLLALCFTSFAFAQSEKYMAAMKSNISQLDSIMPKGNYTELSNNFERIGDAEKTQWLPYYYAAYCTVTGAYNEKDNGKKDGIADKAKTLLDKAETLAGKENSEIDVIKAMIATSHMMVDPQSRYMTYGAEFTTMINKAKALDPTNPRPVLLQAENTFYTPEQFGGGKDAAKPMLDQASKLFDAFKPETELSPNWGHGALQYFLSQYN